MNRIFKYVITRRDDGYTIAHDVIYFTDDHEQCDKHGKCLSDPIFTFNLGGQAIVEVTNPDEFSIAKHATYVIITDIPLLRDTWTKALSNPQTIFTTLPLNVFSDAFHKETLR